MEKSTVIRVARGIVVLFFLGFSISCNKEFLDQEEFSTLGMSVNDADVVKDQYIILLSDKPAKKDNRAEAALEALSKEVGNMPEARLKGTFRHSVTGFVAKLSPEQVERLRKDKRVFSITADRYIELESNSNTSPGSAQEYPGWGLDRIDQRTELLDRIYAYNATGTAVNAYIMDSGIKYSHSEFGGRASLGIDLVREYPDTEWDNDDPEVEDGGDCSGHGTHVSGTVGGSEYGVAKNVNLVSVRVFSCVGRTTWSRIVLAVDWITENAKFPAVVNMSLGGPYETDVDPMELAINRSIEKGITYVIAAGNSQSNACNFTPARVTKALTVGASDIYNKRAFFSNYGDCLDLYAPGLSIMSAGIADDTAIRIFSGTSMSAPHVTGIVALFLEKNPEATPEQVHAEIIGNSIPGFITEVPSGPANLAHSLWETVQFTPPAPPVIEIRGWLSKVRNQHAISIQWSMPEERSHFVYKDGEVVARMDDGKDSYLEYTNLRNATFVYKVCGVSYANCSRELTVVIGDGGDTSQPDNYPPSANFNFVTDKLSVQFTDTSTDSDGSVIGWSWDFGDGTSSTVQNPQHVYANSGTYNVSLTVTDDDGATGSISKSVSVTAEDQAPGDINLTASGYKVKGRWQADLSWTPAKSTANVDIYRDGRLLRTVKNTGSFTDATNFNGGGSMTYKVCEAGTTTCSNEVIVQF